MFDVALANWVGEPPALCVHSETCGLGARARAHRRPLLLRPLRRAAPTSSATSARRRCSSSSPRSSSSSSGRTSATRCPQYCLECDVRFACHGGCPKDRFIETPDGEPGLNYLCAGFKDFFHHVDRPMRIMGRAARARTARRPRSSRLYAAEDAQARPQRPLHLRLGPQVEALPRDVDAGGRRPRRRSSKGDATDAAGRTKPSVMTEEEPVSQTIKKSGRAEASREGLAARVDHLTVEERIGTGSLRGVRCPARRTRRGSRRPTGRALSSCSRNRRRPGCRSSCRSATGGCSSRRSRSIAAPRYLMASDLVGRAEDRPARAALRRRAPVELRRLRSARPPARLQHQRLRRDAARPVRVGRQAARGELRRRRARPRLRRQAAGGGQPRRRTARTGRRCTLYAGMREPRPLVHARRRRRPAHRDGTVRDRKGAASGADKNLAKTRTKDSLRAFSKLTEIVDGAAADHQRPAGDDTDRGPRSGTAPASSTSSCTASPRVPADAERRPPAAARALPLRPRGPQGRRRRQRRARAH